MTGIIMDGVRLGTVASFAGNKRSEKWVAWSIHRKSADEENSARFSNMHAAIDWLQDEHARLENGDTLIDRHLNIRDRDRPRASIVARGANASENAATPAGRNVFVREADPSDRDGGLR